MWQAAMWRRQRDMEAWIQGKRARDCGRANQECCSRSVVSGYRVFRLSGEGWMLLQGD